MIDLPAGRISGPLLKALVTAVRKTPTRHVVARLLRHQLGIDALRELPHDSRSALPSSFAPIRARAEHRRPGANLAPWDPEGSAVTARSLARAYAARVFTPEELTERALAAARHLASRSPSMGPLLDYDDEGALEASRHATKRLAHGAPLGPLDGVVVAIKEEVRVRGLPCRVGSGWMPSTPADGDSVAVARLRAAGAVILGTTAMTEYGMSPLGGNVHRTMPRNPHHTGHLPGGSSSGSGVAVATGVVPVALGADGGGSIRIPACYCGVFGLKPTFGRVPVSGHGLQAGSSVVHLGPIGASVEDLALFLDATAGFDADDATSAGPALEPGELVSALGAGVAGLRIGVADSEWAAASDDVAAPARRALEALEREGAVLVPIELPLAAHAAAIGYLTIGLETLAGMLYERVSRMDELGLDLQMLLANLETFRADDYLDAQRLRATLRGQVAAVLAKVDLIALPTTALGAPPITDAEATGGFVDPPALDAACRFAFLGNLTGCPAGTAPVGRDRNGLPVGLQLLGDAWDEGCVLSALAHLERVGAARVERPPVTAELF